MSKCNIRQLSRFVNKKYRLYTNIFKSINCLFLNDLFCFVEFMRNLFTKIFEILKKMEGILTQFWKGGIGDTGNYD